MGDLNPALYDFVDFSHSYQTDANYDDLVEQKIFKYKYRQFAHDTVDYERKNRRMMIRFFERVQSRNPAIEADLNDILAEDQIKYSIG